MDAGEFQIRLADLQAKLAEVQEKFRELPAKVGGAADQRVSAVFADIDPAVSPHAHAVQNAGHGFYDLIDGLVHAVTNRSTRRPVNHFGGIQSVQLEGGRA